LWQQAIQAIMILLFFSVSLIEKFIFLAKKELFQRRMTNWLFQKLHAIPVDRQSGMVIRPVRRSLKVIENGEVFGIFPEGKRCKNGEVSIRKKGVAFSG
jgi:1-acyl-sn-glycerol-3-phosphate acyltransferase